MKISEIINRVRDERGQALVEFALIFTMLVVLLFGIAEFGRGWFYANAVSNGARDGVRYASMQPKPNFRDRVHDYTYRQVTSSVKPRYRDQLYVNVSAFRTGGGVAPFDNLSAGDAVTVIVGYKMDIVTGNIIPYFSGSKIIVRKATMRFEGN